MDKIGKHPVSTTDQSFQSLGVSPQTLNLIKQLGFEHPTPIQAQVIPAGIEGKDLLGLAQTGSGKTAAFVIPVAERLQHGQGTRGLILCPTREIALQTKAFLDLFGKHHHLVTACVIGGVGMHSQIKELKNKPDIIVATPGRLMDHVQRGNVSLSKVEELVFDEADHMLDLGFLPQIKDIMRKVPKKRHTLMFSATMPSNIEGLAQAYLHNPLRVDIIPEGQAAEGITHRLYMVDKENKKKCLLALLHLELGSTLVFTRTRLDANWLFKVLEQEGHPVAMIHSDRNQRQRVRALEGFRAGEHRILIATDIASRGIDVQGIQHVVNYEMPARVEEYVHRAGRTARGESVGLVSSIATWQDKPLIKEIEEALGQEIPRCTVAGVEAYKELKVRSVGRRGQRIRRR